MWERSRDTHKLKGGAGERNSRLEKTYRLDRTKQTNQTRPVQNRKTRQARQTAQTETDQINWTDQRVGWAAGMAGLLGWGTGLLG